VIGNQRMAVFAKRDALARKSRQEATHTQLATAASLTITQR
jgi:hypothetical protein